MTIQAIKDLILTPPYDFLRTEPRVNKSLILLGLGGSHAYGTDVETSDVDIRGCALNSKEDILTNQNFEQFVNTETDTTIYAFNKLVSLLSACNPNTIEILGLKPEHYLYIHPIGQELLDNSELFLSKIAVHSFGGYANAQLRRLDNKAVRMVGQAQREQHIMNSINNASYSFKNTYFPTSENDSIKLYLDTAVNEDFDQEIFMDVNLTHYPLRDYTSMWSEMKQIVRDYGKIGSRNQKAIEHGKLGKHMMHLVRLYLMAFDILENKKIITYREDDHNLLMNIRNGMYLDDNNQPIPEFYDMVDEFEDRLIQIGGHTFNVIETGLKHGTLTIGVDHDYFEVTTFRIDGQYEDCRRPSSVSFTTSLEEDLSRRDFTINAIAYSPSKGIIDPYNGIQDIQDKIIRCVGSPSMRFNEDGLRILRALRFSAQLKFYIHPDTSSAIMSNKCLLDRISKERIHSELIKIICSEQCGTQVLRTYAPVFYQVIPAIKPMVGFKQNNPYHIYDVWEHTLHCMSGFPSTDVNMDELVIRLSLLFHDIGKPYCYSQDKNHIGHFYGHAASSADIAYNTLKDLKFSNEIIHNVVEIVANHDRQIVPTKPCLKKILNKLGESQMWRLLIVRASDLLGQAYKINIERHHELEQVFALYHTILNQKECFSLKDLDMNGDDLIVLGIPEGKEIGRILNTLLQAVIDEKVENKYVPLLNYINDNIYKLGDESND